MFKAIKLIAVLVGVVAISVVSIFGTMKFADLTPIEIVTESASSQIINSIERKEEVVLLSLGIQGIDSRSTKAKIFNIDLAGSDKATFIQYFFYAKLGIDGRKVTIEEINDGHFEVTIPEFIFIGHNDVEFALVLENNGILSFVAPKIDTVEMVNQILGPDKKQEYIEKHKEVLTEQAEAFYKALIHAVDPTVRIDFKFDKVE